MRAISTLREINERLSADDVPLWAEVFGIVFAIGLFVRDWAHVVAALGADKAPQLRDHDITASSPVDSLDKHVRVDGSARLLAVALGIGLVVIAQNVTHPIVAVFVLANAMVPLADPVLFIASKTQ